ncbi:hypothetical protein HF086_000898 [Spodoptera exigua]|uniref:Death domain-containing protein n=1 Tax=Spodoptera exigua TaxID=7107 RepID=A0A922SHW0_SPOEX|nr:hypothetical protein HF086_000898 [Spodoptera exigua]
MSDKLGFDELRNKYKDVLSKAFTTNNIDLLDSFTKNTNETDRKAAMDHAFRDKLLELLIEEPDTLENFVSFCIESCRRQMVTPTMPVVLLGDIFDALTLNKCEKLFSYVENGVSIWKEELFFVACKNNLLRMCNDLLRRLSRSQNTVFCGRILLFLAKFFPFSERSGLNIVSEFNLENVTEFGGDSSSTLKDSLDEEMVVDNNEKNKINIDYNLYCRFWSLQDFFRNPNNCYNKLQWKTFVAHSGSVLSAFSSYKLETVELQKSKLNLLKPVKTVATDAEMKDSETNEPHYFAKFLTNQKLLELQLSDSNFRRCVLVQFLILFQYLTSTVKFKMEVQELKSDQVDWVKETTALVYKLLGETPPNGKQFAECKPKPPVSVESTDEVKKSRKRRRPVGDIIKEYEAQNKSYMGNNELTKLWNLCPDNLAACRTKERDFMPSLGMGNNIFFILNTIFLQRENNEEEITEEQMEADLIKEGDANDIEQVPDSTHAGEEDYDKTSRSRVTMISPAQLEALSSKLTDWKKLAAKLGYKADEIQFFETENATDSARAKNMLQLWFDDDEDASVENLLYIMEGLKMTDACEALKNVK